MYAAPNSSLHPFRRLRRESERAPELLALKHTSRILGHSYMWFLHDGTGLTMCCLAHVELAWLFLEPDTGLDHFPRIPLSCLRARTSCRRPPPSASARLRAFEMRVTWRTELYRGVNRHLVPALGVVASSSRNSRNARNRASRVTTIQRPQSTHSGLPTRWHHGQGDECIITLLKGDAI